MSYLLDALNKSRGEPNEAPTEYSGQSYLYAQPGFSKNDGPNIYKWISIALALVLTLIIGIFVGNRYALFSPDSSAIPNTQLQPVVVTQPNQAQPDNTQTNQTQKSENNTNTPEQVAVSDLANAIPPSSSNKTSQLATKQNSLDDAFVSQVQSEKPKIVGYVPENDADQGAIVNDDSVSQDLLSRFNDAIKQSEGAPIEHTQAKPDDFAVDEYLTKAPKLRELSREQQLRVPGFTYDTHLFASDPAERKVKLNGITFSEKEWISNEIQIFEIQRQFLVFEMGHLRFSMPALTDWQDVDKSASNFQP